MPRHAIGKLPESTSEPRIRVAIADDSTVARAMISWMLEQAGMDVVATASNGLDAINVLATTKIDVLVLDLEMPRLDGLSALPDILNATSAAVLVVSALTTRGAQSTIEALRLGAADTLTKPNMVPGGKDSRGFGELLVEKVRALVSNRAHPRVVEAVSTRAQRLAVPLDFRGPLDVIAIAASTGGPTAMFELFANLDLFDDIPMLVTQHLPPPFVPVLAEHLSRHARRPAVVAANGQKLQPGTIHLAPGTAHLGLARHRGSVVVHLDDAPAPSGCKPSADVMFEAVAKHYGEKAMAVILSGMGRDGAEGARMIRGRGGMVLAQDMQSSVIWGMPGIVSKQGIAQASAPPAGIAALINSLGGRAA